LVNREIITRSADETFEVGRSIGERLSGGAVILLSGDLGAGKTVFAKGLAAGLGIVPSEVTSPSFTLINEYEIDPAKRPGPLSRLYHVDLYRLDSASCSGLGLDEMFADPRAVVAIEWAERLPELPDGAISVQIEAVSDDERRIRIASPAVL
jgi:tRNA threonylcarbamoyladenosine biosynthesis protein TsaE